MYNQFRLEQEEIDLVLNKDTSEEVLIEDTAEDCYIFVSLLDGGEFCNILVLDSFRPYLHEGINEIEINLLTTEDINQTEQKINEKLDELIWRIKAK